MNNKEKRILKQFPLELDNAVTKKFGVECVSKPDFLGKGTYKTYYEGKGQKAKEIKAFIEGYVAGNIELRNRLKSA